MKPYVNVIRNYLYLGFWGKQSCFVTVSYTIFCFHLYLASANFRASLNAASNSNRKRALSASPYSEANAENSLINSPGYLQLFGPVPGARASKSGASPSSSGSFSGTLNFLWKMYVLEIVSIGYYIIFCGSILKTRAFVNQWL